MKTKGLLGILALTALPLAAQTTIAPVRIEIIQPTVFNATDSRGYVIKITNPKAVYPFEDYTCGSYSQRVTKDSDTAVTIRTESPKLMPRPRQP